MHRPVVLVVAFALILTSVAVPSAVADCPPHAHHCRSVSPGVISILDDAVVLVTAFKDSAEIPTSSANEEDHPIPPIGDDQGSSDTMSHEFADDYLRPGDSGGVLVVVERVGGANGINLSFDAEATGITWSGSNNLIITSSDLRDGAHFMIPFTVNSVSKDIDIDFDVADNRGNTDSKTLHIPILLVDRGIPTMGMPLTMVLFAGVAALVAVQRRRSE